MNASELKSLIERYPFQAMPIEPGKNFFQIVTGPVRCHYVQLDKLYGNQKYPQKAPEASVTLIIPPSASIAPLQDLAKTVARQHFGDKLNTVFRVRNPVDGSEVETTLAKALQWPWLTQAKNKGKPGFSTDGSGYFLRASSRKAPIRILDKSKQQIAADDPAIYDGMWCRALLNVYAYPKEVALGQKVHGVGVGILQLQKIADDDRLPRGGNGDSAFDIVEAGSAVNSGSAGGASIGAAPDFGL